jgi:hypothetical protein
MLFSFILASTVTLVKYFKRKRAATMHIVIVTSLPNDSDSKPHAGRRLCELKL